MGLKLILDPFYFIEGRHMKPGGKGGGSKAPAAPDPAQTAAAQGQMSKDVALWNSSLNNVNQITPFGNLTWTLGSSNAANGTPQTQPTNSGNSNLYYGSDGKIYDTSQDGWATKYIMANGLASGPGLPGYASAFMAGQSINDLQSGNYEKYGLKPLSGVSGGSSSGGFTSDGMPQWTSKVELSPESQAIFDSYMRQQNQLGGLSESALNQVSQAYANPYNYDSLQALYGADDLDAARSRTEEAIYSRLNPQFAKDEEALRSRLINQGIGQGSQAYQREMENFNQMKNDARMQTVLAGGAESDRALAQSMSLRQQGIQELDKLRGQPLNEYLAMSGQQQLAMPQFQQHNYQGAGTPDYQGLVNQQYQGQMAQYNANQASSNNMMGGLFGLGGQALGGFLGSSAGGSWLAPMLPAAAAASDIRVKKNIKPIGEENGFPIYEFEYDNTIPNLPKGKFIGVMAQDVEKIMPEAIGESDGYKTVNYDMIGVEMRAANG